MSGVCCICGKRFEEFGNNPWPVKVGTCIYCCDDCNLNVVIPARIERSIAQGQEGE